MKPVFLALALLTAVAACSNEQVYECTVLSSSYSDGKAFSDNKGTVWRIKVGKSAGLVEYWRNANETKVIGLPYPVNEKHGEIQLVLASPADDLVRSHFIHKGTLHFRSVVKERIPKTFDAFPNPPGGALYIELIDEKGSCRKT